eukprot:gnl/TRDRNA2_/TRDRNA2_158699_c2_seq1.p2 gnl/TRDRNA2_/TRDRNA2_158699_c2~~gnl/TRDRNA2_/TRDRNA2_158699_c2_seq1.p2  ORF type:complete len:128 (+),score=26.30 gnl/TRDRNA2_/TRDRNA2_158699_c2_seq1:38-421(+)
MFSIVKPALCVLIVFVATSLQGCDPECNTHYVKNCKVDYAMTPLTKEAACYSMQKKLLCVTPACCEKKWRELVNDCWECREKETTAVTAQTVQDSLWMCPDLVDPCNLPEGFGDPVKWGQTGGSTSE